MKIPNFLLRLIQSFIRNREFAVHVNNTVSNKIKIPAGLAQGTCLSPILYALFVADMPIKQNTVAALYADDTAIYTSAKRSNTIIKHLNESLISLQLYFTNGKLKSTHPKHRQLFFHSTINAREHQPYH